MAENKQYITQIQENGNVLISEDVISAIVTRAVVETEGVDGLHNGGKKGWNKALKITISEAEELTIDCAIDIVYGQSVVAVSEAAQKAVCSAINSMTGIDVKNVNISVNGIVRK